MKEFAQLRDPLFIACLIIYSANRAAEDCGYSHWILRGYLNDLICVGFWVPIVTFMLGYARLRDPRIIPRDHEIVIAVIVWALMFEFWLPQTTTFATLMVADPWDVICYAGGGLAAAVWWRSYYQDSVCSAELQFTKKAGTSGS